MKHTGDDIDFRREQADASFQHELDVFLARAAEATDWHDARVLKQSDFETTELVRGTPREGASGLYVRKTIDVASGAGCAYEELWAQQLQGVSLPCVPRLVECRRGASSLVVVMEHVDGCTVEQLAASLGAGLFLAAQVMTTLCRSVQMLHTCLQMPLIHRDLKPSNIIMRGGEAMVIDFGCARAWHPDAESDTTHFLTRCYAPPEQFGFGQTDERTDVYALGKVLFFCLTGEQPPNLCDANACRALGIHPELARVVERACSFDPAERYESAADLGAAVEGVFAALAEGAVTRGGSALSPKSSDGVFAVTDGVSDGISGPALRAAAVPFRVRGVASHALELLRDGISGLAVRASAVVPDWVGVVWNAVVLFFFAGMVWQSIDTIVHPLPRDVGLPMAYLVFRAICFIDPFMMVVAYLLLDRRRLRRQHPVFARLSVMRETGYGVAFLGVLTFACALVVACTGW
ncbi:protein kinase [Collinsella sp. BA40]|uniref:serine/threonine protein kinase n=1 Tax=Collinsella sp. BA40 TaxID=2560852 RepID=UPI0011CA3FB0|nr:protein kinase [Collinsella sp. BA40]TXF34934.1 protein kinase [Collinsella sp. BA40]